MSFSRAADDLFMTQPGVSNHVTQLETQAGVSLLRRDRGGRFELTKEGKVVYRYAQRIEKIARELENTLHTLHKKIRPLLRIGTVPTYSRIMMPHVLGSFQKAEPDIKIKLDVGSSSEMEKSLLSGRKGRKYHISRCRTLFPDNERVSFNVRQRDGLLSRQRMAIGRNKHKLFLHGGEGLHLF